MIIQLYRGDSPTLTFNVTKEGDSVSLAGFSMYFSAAIAPLSNSNTYIFNGLCDNSATIDNQCSITLSSLDSMSQGSYVAELYGIEADVYKTTFGQWDLRISASVKGIL